MKTYTELNPLRVAIETSDRVVMMQVAENEDGFIDSECNVIITKMTPKTFHSCTAKSKCQVLFNGDLGSFDINYMGDSYPDELTSYCKKQVQRYL